MKHSWEFRKQREEESDGSVHILYRCVHCGLYRRAIKCVSGSLGYQTVFHYLRKGEVFADGSPKWLRDRPECVQGNNIWTKRARIVDEQGVAWDEFINQDGSLIKRESRDCYQDGKLVAHPMRCYAKRKFPSQWYSRLSDIK